MQIKKMFVLAALLVAACDGDSAGPGQEIPREPVRGFTVQESRLADASVGFGLKLFQEVSSRESNKLNVLVSPLSVSMALGMTMNGAEDGTYNAMRSGLGFGTLSEAEINAAYKGLIAQLLARDAKVEFNLANSIWYKNTFQVKQPFLDAARNFFSAEVEALNFSDPGAPKRISAWAEQETGGRIKDLIKSIDPLEVMFLVNAVYFKAPWSQTFDERSTRDGAFTREDGSTVTAKLMNKDGNFRYVQNGEVHAVELLYGDSAFSMVIAMPASGRALGPLVSRLNTTWWSGLIAAMSANRIILTLPKFKFEYEKKLNDPLAALGMGVIFDEVNADFDRIGNRDDLFVSRVEHKTFIEVHEQGTEAAAATAVGISPTSLPPEVRFNRPFIFAIRERSSGTILFVGKVGDPTS